MSPHPTAPRLSRTLITTKLVAIVAVFVAVIAAVIGLFVLAYNVSAGVRAYVGGEGLWSKGQKDAVYALTRYLDSQHEGAYREYLTAIAMPLGDRAARLEMEKPELDPAKVTAGFVQGGISAEDVPYMIFLFRYFDAVPYFAQAIEVWRLAERQVLRLPPVAEAARGHVQAGTLSAERRAALLAEIDDINARVTPLEQQFSSVLGEGAREVQALLLKVTLAVAAALIAMGVLFAWSISRNLRASIRVLHEGAVRVAAGDLSAPIAVRSGDELGALAVMFNTMIDARREAEAALRTAKDFSDKVMEGATNAIYTLDPQGVFTTANRRTCEMTGYPLEELIGQTWAPMVPAEELPALMAGFISTVEGREPVTNRECHIRRKSGEELTITFSIAPLMRDGVILGVVGVAEDITARKRAEAEREAHAQELARSNRELEQFAYVTSHDLQEPLRTVTGFVQLLSRRYPEHLDGDAKEFIGYITDGVARMKSLIEDLLAYSRVQRADVVAEPMAMDGLLSAAIANLRGAIDAAQATVVAEPLPVLTVDGSQFTQLFQNLIGNAIKFRGTAAPRIHIQALPRERDWLFSVADNGIGIDAAAAERVFVLFQRLHTREHYEGNGIGLTLCKKIVELHGGRIWVEPASDDGSATGSVFRFTLPMSAPGALSLAA